MDVFEIIMIGFMFALVIGISIIYAKQYKKLIKSSESNAEAGTDMLLNVYADDLIGVVATALEVHSIKRSNYKTEEAYRKDVTNIIAKDVMEFLKKNELIPSMILASLTDEILCNVILKVISYIEDMSQKEISVKKQKVKSTKTTKKKKKAEEIIEPKVLETPEGVTDITDELTKISEEI